MKRIALFAGNSAQSPKYNSVQPLGTPAETSPEDLPHYSLFAPQRYEPNYAYPLLIWLHGPRDNERQLRTIMPLVSLQNYVAIGPRATMRGHDDEPGFFWGNSAGSIASAERAVLDCLDIARGRFHVDPKRVFLAGYACGGTMAFQIGLRHPDRFAGVLSLGGPFPTGNSLLSSLPRLRELPLFIAQGRDSTRYSVERLCSDLKLFHVAGLSVSVRQYPVDDDLTTKMLQDMNVWLMEQVTGQPHVESEPLSTVSELN